MANLPQRALILNNGLNIEAKDIDHDFLLIGTYELPQHINHISSQLCGSCRGIVLFVRWYQEQNAQARFHLAYLWNPFNGEISTIRDVDFPPGSRRISFGFGYDDNNNDFKIVRTLEFPDEHGDSWRQIRVYSRRDDTWGEPLIQIAESTLPFWTYGMVTDDHIVHWIFQDRDTREYRLRGFDIRTNDWADLPLPIEDGHVIADIEDLGVLGGCLCVVNRPERRDHKGKRVHDVSDVWLMTVYGDNDSWVRFSISNASLGEPLRSAPLAYSNNTMHDEVLLRRELPAPTFSWFNFINNNVMHLQNFPIPYFDTLICVSGDENKIIEPPCKPCNPEPPIVEPHPLSLGTKTEYPYYDIPFKREYQPFIDHMLRTDLATTVKFVQLKYDEELIRLEREKARVTELESGVTVTEPEIELE